MILPHHYYSCFLVLLAIDGKSFVAAKCYECDGMIFNSSLTVDNIPAPTRHDCTTVLAENSCSVRIGWYKDNTTEVYYGADTPLPIDSIMVKIERKVTTWSGDYETRRFIVYNCNASAPEPCNTVENIKRAIASTTFATDEQIEKFDSLIVPTTDFDSRQCFKFSNASDCRETNLLSCQQCIGIIHYSTQPDTCATCPANKAITNYFDYETTFFLANQTRSDVVRLGCRKYGPCNSIDNMGKIKNTLNTYFDFAKFSSSSVPLTFSTIVFIGALAGLGLSRME